MSDPDDTTGPGPAGAPPCGHPLCALLGDECRLATGLSRGCRTGWSPARTFAPEVIDEVRALLVELAPERAGPDRIAAATRLAYLYRREARDERNLLVLAGDDEDELEPALRARLATLCRRRRG